jgi:hypothetical protein
MNNQLISSILISFIFFVFRFMEMKFIIKESKPIKELATETMIVFISSMASLLLLEQFNISELVNKTNNLFAFTSEPDF